jgi:transposase
MKDVENEEITSYILKNNANVREVAKHFGISRQTVCNRIKKSKNEEVQKIMELHFKYRSKYKYLKEN